MLLLISLLTSTVIFSLPLIEVSRPQSSSSSASSSTFTSHRPARIGTINHAPPRTRTRPSIIVLPSRVIHLTPAQQALSGFSPGLQPWRNPFAPPGHYVLRARTAPWDYDEWTRRSRGNYYHAAQIPLEVLHQGTIGTIEVSTWLGDTSSFFVTMRIAGDALVNLYRTTYGRELSQIGIDLNLLLAPADDSLPLDHSETLPRIEPHPARIHARPGTAAASQSVLWYYNAQTARRERIRRTYTRLNQGRRDGQPIDFRIVFEWVMEWTDRPLLSIESPRSPPHP